MNLRYLWRSLLCVYVLLCVLFSPLCYASQTEVVVDGSSDDFGNGNVFYSFDQDEIQAGYLSTMFSARIRTSQGSSFTRTLIPRSTYIPPFNFTSDRDFSTSDYNYFTTEKQAFQCYVSFLSPSEFSILDADKSFNIDLSGLSFAYENGYYFIDDAQPSYNARTIVDHIDLSKLSKIVITLYANSDFSGTFKEYTVTDSFTTNGDTFGVTLKDVQTTFDVKAFRLWFTFDPDAFSFDESSIPDFYEWTGVGRLLAAYTDSMLTIHENDSSTGLLNGILDWLRNIRDGITSVGQGVTNVVSSITQLPAKIQDMLVGLIVPDDEIISSKFSDLENLLRSRFGLIYQAEEVVVDFANSLQTSTMTSEAAGGKIIFPTVAVNLPQGAVFSFGGYEVDLVPDGFEFLQDAVRLAINMICTVVFINMCKSKLEVIFK